MLDVIYYCIILYYISIMLFYNANIFSLVKDQLNNLSDVLNAFYDI